MTKTLTYTGSLVITSCWCGIHLAIPADLYDLAQRKGETVYCPLGHTFVFGDTEYDRLKREAQEAREREALAKRQAEFARSSREAAWDQVKAEQRSNAALRGWITRLRRKVANGVCPVGGCRRHFDNVQAHIQTQHPEWAHEHPEVLT